MMKLVRVLDDHSFLLKWRIKNETLVCQLSLAQLVVTAASLAQHVYSLYKEDEVFLCSFNETYSHLVKGKAFYPFLAADVIIFDYGLFHRLIGVDECIANYLDGGYMRCLWCVTQLLAILSVLVLPCIAHPQPYILWPMILLQNSYCLGLTILSIATVDKLLMKVISEPPTELTYMILIYFSGTWTNYFLNYILWHLYWHIEAAHDDRQKNNIRVWL